MKSLIIKFLLIIGMTNVLFSSGKITGAQMHQTPDWFKASFLDMVEDTEEAASENRHVMLFLDLDGCPYCTRMMNESFIQDGPTKNFIKENFDVININIKR